MTVANPTKVAEEVVEAIASTVRDYYGGWFEGDVTRMQRALHPELVKRGIVQPTGVIDTDTAASMVEATAQGIGTRYDAGRRGIAISINHVHGDIADVHVTGDVYVDYLQLVQVDGRWQILNALWALAQPR